MAKLSDDVRVILDKKSFAHIATLMPDGSPHVSPVWVDYEGNTVVINTATGRQKPANLDRDRRVAMSVTDPEDPYKVVMIRGTVSEITSEGAEEHADRLARKYLGKETYPFRRPNEERLIVRIHPEKVTLRS
jgi:PPOX class probable F420-dependent enzyme